MSGAPALKGPFVQVIFGLCVCACQTQKQQPPDQVCGSCALLKRVEALQLDSGCHQLLHTGLFHRHPPNLDQSPMNASTREARKDSQE